MHLLISCHVIALTLGPHVNVTVNSIWHKEGEGQAGVGSLDSEPATLSPAGLERGLVYRLLVCVQSHTCMWIPMFSPPLPSPPLIQISLLYPQSL